MLHLFFSISNALAFIHIYQLPSLVGKYFQLLQQSIQATIGIVPLSIFVFVSCTLRLDCINVLVHFSFCLILYNTCVPSNFISKRHKISHLG